MSDNTYHANSDDFSAISAGQTNQDRREKRHLATALFLLVAMGALAFRLPQLDRRPMHADESVHAARFRDLWQHGRYRYNPDEFHGPTLVYATLPAVWASGAATFADTTEATYRIVPAIFGASLVLLVWPLAGGLGRSAALWAGVLTAVSPAMVFYSRYYIHETLLVFFTLAAVAAGWCYFRSRRFAWCAAAGACLGLVQATKETSVMAYFAAGVATVLTPAWARLLGERPREDRWRPPIGHLVWGLVAAVVVAVVLYSSLLTNPRGPLDAVLTYLPWTGRAGGASVHIHPWHEYLHRLGWWRVDEGPLWSEGFVLVMAGVGAVLALLPVNVLCSGASRPLLRWLAFYTLALTAAYSIVPYKTPWCALGFLHGMILLAGCGIVALVRAVPTTPLKTLTALFMLGATGHLAWQAYRASYVLPADVRNPYAYAQTSQGIRQLAGDLAQLADAGAHGRRTPVKIIWKDGYYWPLPWYLRRFEAAEWWTSLPEEAAAPLVLASPEYDIALTEKLDATHLMTGYYEIRPRVLAELWVAMDLWEAHLRRLGRL